MNIIVPGFPVVFQIDGCLPRAKTGFFSRIPADIVLPAGRAPNGEKHLASRRNAVCILQRKLRPRGAHHRGNGRVLRIAERIRDRAEEPALSAALFVKMGMVGSRVPFMVGRTDGDIPSVRLFFGAVPDNIVLPVLFAPCRHRHPGRRAAQHGACEPEGDCTGGIVLADNFRRIYRDGLRLCRGSCRGCRPGCSHEHQHCCYQGEQPPFESVHRNSPSVFSFIIAYFFRRESGFYSWGVFLFRPLQIPG